MVIENFEFAYMFRKFGNLRIINSKIYLESFGADRAESIYAIVVNGEIIKIGSTTTKLRNRIYSYNSGNCRNRENGTCSTTNFKVYQHLLNLEKSDTIEVFAFFPELVEVPFFDKTTKIGISAKVYEKHILQELKKKGELPILCKNT